MPRLLRSNINSQNPIVGRAFVVGIVFVVVHLLNSFVPIIEIWNSRLYDLLFNFRNEFTWTRPPYSDVVVHVDLDDVSVQSFDDYYLNRAYHARVVENLDSMGVKAQLHDFIFAAPSDQKNDTLLIESVRKSGNAYFGMAFNLQQQKPLHVETGLDQDIIAYLKQTQWNLDTVTGSKLIPYGSRPLISFLPLAQVSKGLGFLNLQADRDGLFRRAPLLVRFGESFYPSIAFRVVCDSLDVTPENIVFDIGASLTLKEVLLPGWEKRRDLKIPLDKNSNLRVNYLGPWERMKHYHFSDIWRASEDRDEMELWREELQGKIAVIAQVTTGSSDMGVVPTDVAYPLSGINASIIHTILTESFLKELESWCLLLAEALLLLIIFLLSFRKPALQFTTGTVVVTALYVIGSALLFIKMQLIGNLMVPVMLALLSLVGLEVLRAHESGRELQRAEMEKNLFEKELEIGRQIQAGFFPEQIPQIPGWQLEAFFKPARQVAGDFYDVFSLEEGKTTGVVIADICDKGVGSALFMALTRSLVRASALKPIFLRNQEALVEQLSLEQKLLRTVLLTNNYIAETHGSSNMFATLFIGVLDHATGILHYINCGHDAPVIFRAGRVKNELKPTGPALGLFPDLEFKTAQTSLEEEEFLLLFTDGVTDAQNPAGELFGRERLIAVAGGNADSANQALDQIVDTVEQFIMEAKQFDDITLVGLRRGASPGHVPPVVDSAGTVLDSSI